MKITILMPQKKQHKPQTYQLKIALKYSQPLIWRSILVSDMINLRDLHLIIQSIFNWDNYHLYEFELADQKRVTDSDTLDEIPEEDIEESKDVFLYEALVNKGDKIHYLYDFGDGWDHMIELQKIIEDKPIKEPQLLKAVNYAPVEDCGALPGWYEKLEFLKNYPKNPTEDDKELLEWLIDAIPELEDLKNCRDFDPTKVNKEDIQERLKYFRSMEI